MNQPDYIISTPENVDLSLELAGIGNRVYACLIDTLIISGSLLGLGLIAAGMLWIIALLPTEMTVRRYMTAVMTAVFLLFGFVVFFGYFIFFESIWQGQTPGKRLARIRVVDSNGQPVTLVDVILRNVIRTVDIGFAFIGMLIMLVDNNERRLGDLAAGSLVIKESAPAIDIHSPLTDSVTAGPFLDIGKVSPQDYELLQSFLGRRASLNLSHRALLARRLENYFLSRLDVPSDGTSSERFLERLVAAYKRQAQTDSL